MDATGLLELEVLQTLDLADETEMVRAYSRARTIAPLRDPMLLPNPQSLPSPSYPHLASKSKVPLRLGNKQNLSETDDDSCAVCMQTLCEPTIWGKCGHIYCRVCTLRCLEHSQLCALCRSPTSHDPSHPSAILAEASLVQKAMQLIGQGEYNQRLVEHASQYEVLENRVRESHRAMIPLYLVSDAQSGLFLVHQFIAPEQHTSILLSSPRERWLVDRSLKDCNGLFGVVLENDSAPGARGMLVHIVRQWDHLNGGKWVEIVCTNTFTVPALVWLRVPESYLHHLPHTGVRCHEKLACCHILDMPTYDVLHSDFHGTSRRFGTVPFLSFARRLAHAVC